MKAVAAMSVNRVIGANGRIPWHLPEDLKFFKRLTMGHIVLMGRKTFESLGKPLPGRENWVVTTTKDIQGVKIIRNPDLIVPPQDSREIFLIGGAQLYARLLPSCSELFLTVVEREVTGDTFFPKFESDFLFKEVLYRTTEMQIRRYQRR